MLFIKHLHKKISDLHCDAAKNKSLYEHTEKKKLVNTFFRIHTKFIIK